MEIEPIGFFRCSQTFKHESPRQPNYSEDVGHIELHEGQNFEQALAGLNGFKKIWLIFIFDRNSDWKPMVRPQNLDRKIGVFATRAPYRPNSIGMSCVDLIEVAGRTLVVKGHDLLDGTPILDIKPYHPEADAFTEQQALQPDCWYQKAEQYVLNWNPSALEQIEWLCQNGMPAFRGFVQTQLEMQPFDCERKRIFEIGERQWVLAYRTWRVKYSLNENNSLVVEKIWSGYTDSEIEQQEDDRYQDKELHIAFKKKFAAIEEVKQNEAVL